MDGLVRLVDWPANRHLGRLRPSWCANRVCCAGQGHQKIANASNRPSREQDFHRTLLWLTLSPWPIRCGSGRRACTFERRTTRPGASKSPY